jgi:hypothetical protein
MAERAFRVLTIRSAGMTAQPALYPLLSPMSEKIIAWEELDGTGSLIERYCRASGVTVSQVIDGAERPHLRLRRLKISVYVTAGRLALACERYRTTNAWEIAGPGGGFGARGVTGARTARRQQGSVMVGHIRYPWIRSVSPRPRTWRYGRDALIIEYAMAPQIPMLLRLDLRLRRGLTPQGMAMEICRLVATYWKDHGTNLPPEVQAEFSALAERAKDGTARPGVAGAYEFPTWYPVTAAVPFFRRPRRSSPPYGGDEAGAE